MIGIEWDVPASLTTTAGTLQFNTFPGLILVPKQCSANKDVRATVDPVPQGDGDIFHHRWLTGYTYSLVCQAFESNSEAACLDGARLLFEELALHLEAMRNRPGRYCWIPSGYGDTRALDYAQWLTGVTQSLSDGGIWQAEFEIDSPLPYVIDLTQQLVQFFGLSASGPITNNGNISFYPVIKVFGPTSGFSVINDTLLEGIVYDAGRPGGLSISGTDYAEIDTYKGTIFLNGNGADLSAGINPTLTNLEDPFRLIPGVNDIECNGASRYDFLVNNSWA